MGNILAKRKLTPEDNDATFTHKKPKIITSATVSTSATPTTSSSGFRCKYDVFISFRREDTRCNFTSHLYTALCDKKVKTFKDDVCLKRGDKTSPMLYEAIENSKISIVVFSKDYASSRWCLDELVHIFKCKAERGQVVMPVFYGIDPSDIQNQSGSFGSAFVEHEKRFKHEKVAQWRSALQEVGSLSGWDSSSRNHGCISQLVKDIAEATVSRLFYIYSSVTDIKINPFVGMEKRLKALESLLCVDSQDVRVIGLWGTAGIGKSTLAKMANKRFSYVFESCFFIDVNGSRHLKKDIYAALLKDKDIDIECSFSDDRLARTKAFLVLDNVNGLEQIKCLTRDPAQFCGTKEIKSRFGSGSVIILTSRDKKFLMEMADCFYEVEKLDEDESARLFHQNAFRGNHSLKTIEYTELSIRAVAYSEGNPLAIKVLSSYLCLRSVREWESALIKLELTLCRKIQKTLKICYDALNRVEKSIFLDIACYYKGEEIKIVETVLGGEARVCISVLVEKCFVSIDEDGRLQMHDLIQEMAWYLVMGLGKLTRLWDPQDVCKVLNRHQSKITRDCDDFLSDSTSPIASTLAIPREVLEGPTEETPMRSSFLCKYDVFISFRGENTRWNFTSHLYAALLDLKIKTYKDNVNLPRGGEISTALYEAIENSKISIVVFSVDYALSRWCLDELVHILKCKKERDQVVLPVFYNIDLSHVRKQSGSFGLAFIEHEKQFDHEKVVQWRFALQEVANLSGWDTKSKDHMSESQLVKDIAKATVSLLSQIYSTITSHQFDLKNSPYVGMERRLTKLESLLRVDSQDVRVIGLWGMGGIGKSTLAKVAKKLFSYEFDSCFFIDVGEDLKKHSPRHLKKEIFAVLLKDKDIDIECSFSYARMARTKAFLVLDNVTDFELFKCFISDSAKFCGPKQIKSLYGAGSRIILTSRDKKLLKEMADCVYKVEGLGKDEAVQLLHWHAFRDDLSSLKAKEYAEQSNRVVAYCGGNPLALKALGSYLHSRSVKEWESALIELEKTPEEVTLRVLKISYDALNHVKQSIFLDIACFFKGESRKVVEDILGGESCVGISVLVERCLVSIDEDGHLQMHDLIQKVAWEIVRRDAQGVEIELGKRSRLCDVQDVCSVLESHKGSACTKGIVLDMSKMSQDLQLRPTLFEAMENLRLLKIYNIFSISLHHGLQYLPDSLQYLEWFCYPLKYLPSNFKPQNLVNLRMRSSNLVKLWNGVVHLGNLKYFDMSNSSCLIELPDPSEAPKLEIVNLSRYHSLRQFPKVSHKSKIRYLFLSNCTNLKCLVLPLSLWLLDVRDCVSLKMINTCACTSLNVVWASRCTSLEHVYVDQCVFAPWKEQIDLGQSLIEIASTLRIATNSSRALKITFGHYSSSYKSA